MFCAQCGVKLGSVAATGQRRRSRRTATGDAAERAFARQEFGRIKSVVLTVRGVFAASAVLAVVCVLVLYRVAQVLVGEERHLVHLVMWMGIGEFAMLTVGALLVVRAPLLWTTVAACYWTLNTLLSWWIDDFAIGSWTMLRLLLLASFWFAVGQAARVQRLMAADPTLQIVRKRLDPERRVAGGVADEARLRQRQARAQRWRKGVQLGGLVLLLAVGFWFVIGQLSKPPAVDQSLERFAASLRTGTFDSIGDLCIDGPGGQMTRSLREGLERRGWQAQALVQAAPTVEATDTHATVTYRPGENQVICHWRRDEARWRVVDIDLPPLVAPPVDSALQAFRAAWQQSGADALLAQLRPASRDRIGPALRRILENREWIERRPELGDVDMGKVRDGRARATFLLGDTELTVQFEYWHPQWHVTGLSLR